jgi:large subunit ribosomal protein L23
MKEATDIVQQLLLTEKGTRLTENDNQYLFRVDESANKLQIKSAVEQLFKVKVTGVRTQRRRGKKKRERTWRYGKTASWKRAVVTLKEGDSIDLT